MARSLDESLYNRSPYPTDYRRPSPAPQRVPPGSGYPGGFARPPSTFAPPRTGPSPSPYSPNGFSQYSLPNAISSMSLAPQPLPPRSTSAQGYLQQPPPQPYSQPYPQSYSQSYHAPVPAPVRQDSRPPDLTAPLPTVESLSGAQQALPQRPSPEHVPWIRDVLFLVDRTVAQQQGAPTTSPPEGPVVLSDPVFARLASDAVQILISLLAAAPAQPLPPWFAEATYLRGTLHGSGAFPAQIQRSPRDAFRDFETSARAGVQRAWFRLGRDYEAVGDVARARDCFERGVRAGVESCVYVSVYLFSSSLAHMFPCSASAWPIFSANLVFRRPLQRPYPFFTVPPPSPLLMFLNPRTSMVSSSWESFPTCVLRNVSLRRLFLPVRVPRCSGKGHTCSHIAGSSPSLEARKFVERAAYLGFAPAQYKLGHAYEYAVSPFPFDPLLSVQYYRCVA